MVINNLNVVGISTTPYKADAPLIVDPDAVLSPAIASECLEPVAGRRPEIREPGRRVEHVQLAERHGFDRSEYGRRSAAVQHLGSPVFERPDHWRQI